jgi:hypothetical protein
MKQEELHNTFRNEEEPPRQVEEKPEQKVNPKGKIRSVLEGSFLTRDIMIRQLPFLALLTLLGMIYIFNANQADRMIIQISKTKKDNQEYRYNYINTKSKLMHGTRQSELVHRLEARGIRESKIPPRKIIIEETEE